ncbi:hypothetical protein [Bacillus sp. FJAT-26390]|uniref:hypothetical protein n=1 Tax=Bacillus sp. FJAT-26390 TaxID=1743142 RepID=UPI000807C423|nr:hypothetical protein [Bacillus sp. FJAT-26390]OBZ09126.1 hypothetical protein A7975_23715 [Bacillus sp. FJAT-26390]
MMSRLDLSVELMIKAAIMLFYADCTFGLVAAISKHFFRTWHIPFYMNTPKMKKSAEETKTYSHLELLLRATSKTFQRNSVSQFIGLSAGVLVIVYVILLIGLNGGELTSWWNRRALGLRGSLSGTLCDSGRAAGNDETSVQYASDDFTATR